MKKPWGRQYRFLFFFTLIAGLVVPIIFFLNAVNLLTAAAARGYDDSASTLGSYFIILYLISVASGIAALALLLLRYALRNCLVPMAITFVGMISLWGYILISAHMLRGRGITRVLSLFILALAFLFILFLLGRLFRRVCKGKVLSVSLMLLFAALLVMLFYCGLILFLSDFAISDFLLILLGAFQASLFISLPALAVMAVTATAILLIFRFKIPTDDPPQRERRDEEEELEDDDYDDR